MSKVQAAKEVATNNIANIFDLKKEFQTGKMLPRKSIMLKARLLDLFKAEKTNPLEQEVMEIILKKDRKHGTLSDVDTQTLNWIERNRCTERCTCIRDDGASVLLLEKDRVYRYYKNHDTDRFIIYVEYDVKPEFQMTKELMAKEARGHFAEESAYPKQRTDLRLLDLSQKFFDYYFQPEDDLLSEQINKEEQFTF